MKLILFLIGLGVICYVLAMGVIAFMEKHVPAPGDDSQALIVLGAQVKEDGRLSLQLEWRLEAALAEYQRLPRLIITCGAQGKTEPEPEGITMRKWLIEKGVPEDRIIPETASYDTLQNLKNAKALLPEGVDGVTVVTSDYHLPRAVRIAEDAGLKADGVGSPTLPAYWLKNHAREVLAWGKYFLNKIVPLG